MKTPSDELFILIKSLNTQQDAWIKLCEKVKSAIENNDGKQICLTHHERLDGDTGMIQVSAALRQLEGQQTFQFMVMVPLGVAQQPGMQVAVYPKQVWEKLRNSGRLGPGDEAQVKDVRLTYVLCHPAGCTAEVEATAALIAALKTDAGAVAHAFDSAGKKVSFPIPLAGFAQALEGPPVDNKKYAEARQAQMQKIARRQQELRDAYHKKSRQN